MIFEIFLRTGVGREKRVLEQFVEKTTVSLARITGEKGRFVVENKLKKLNKSLELFP